MATPVLPYPNMDFTPLDILTAAEMDQMVANDQYLRDFCAGLADGTNLSDGVIQARKLSLATTTTSDGWTKTTFSNNVVLYRKAYSLSGSIGGTGQGAVGCSVTPPSEFSTANDINIIGETFRDGTAEIYYRRLDSLQRSGGARIYGVSISGGRTMNGVYTISILKAI